MKKILVLLSMGLAVNVQASLVCNGFRSQTESVRLFARAWIHPAANDHSTPKRSISQDSPIEPPASTYPNTCLYLQGPMLVQPPTAAERKPSNTPNCVAQVECPNQPKALLVICPASGHGPNSWTCPADANECVEKSEKKK